MNIIFHYDPSKSCKFDIKAAGAHLISPRNPELDCYYHVYYYNCSLKCHIDTTILQIQMLANLSLVV